MKLLGGSNATCVDTTGETDITDKVINGDTLLMEVQEILDQFGCTSGQPSQSYKGIYYAMFTLNASPILADGETNITQYLKSFPLTFSF